MRAVFFGTPELAVPSLRALSEVSDVVGVVCQPDRPAGRGLELRQPAVKRAALELGLTIYQPEKVRTGELAAWLSELKADVALVLAYGRILPKAVLDAPRRGCVNLHASLLPLYRGAAPIQWAIIHGEQQTGISLMQMDEGLDSGPVYSRHEIGIGPDETGAELAARLSELAAQVVHADLARVVKGELTAVAQDESKVTLAPPLERAHGDLDFKQPARAVHDRVRGLAPRPGAHTFARGKRLRIAETRRIGASPALAPGEVRVERPRVLIGTGDGAVELVRAQVEGKRELTALELANGRVLVDGDVLGGS
ncbi:MAG TPA: methionyl-tRNA formyltransferase [Polyangiaceae bacterium]|nr:methionyl-tRNA formyltransferase [Polyangiaceae bacterium]